MEQREGLRLCHGEWSEIFSPYLRAGKSAREPQVGDTITVYSFGKSPKGPRIEKGALDGVPSSATHTTVALLARPLEETNACGSSCYAYA